MRKIILLIFVLISINTAVADSIKCFNNGKMIYHRKDGSRFRNVIFTGDVLILFENPSNKITFYFGIEDCLIKIDI